FLFRLSFVNVPEINAVEKTGSGERTDFVKNSSDLNIIEADSQEISTEKNIINDLTVTEKLVNINNASEEELCTLKGIGTKTAEAIIKYRKENGRFECKEDLMKVKGIGKKKYSAVADKIIF
ncbi:MAG TPA: helix-hairpin-helix domain-containing protein, partial [Clostridiales bacterium]|nr:helix-hairpin-helix domain-containing protein [Clostridiales bacterium]